MAKWFSIESKHKKSFDVYEQYEHEENQQKFTRVDNFRDGYVIVKIDEDISLEDYKKQINADADNVVFSTLDQYVEDHEAEDGTGNDYSNFENITEDQVIDLADEDWDSEGTHGFEIVESWMEIVGPLEVKDVTGDYV